MPVPRSMWGRPNVIAAVSLLVALLAFVYGVVGDDRAKDGSRREVTVLFEDSQGQPRSNIVIVTPEGRDSRPDARGMLTLVGTSTSTFEILDAETRRNLRRFLLGETGSITRVVVEP